VIERQRATLKQHLSQIPYFKVLAPEDLDAVAAQAARRTFAPDDVIFLEGARGEGLWVIESGSVKITKLSAEGAEYILHLLGPGHTFNDIAALDGGGAPGNAVALGVVSAWTIPLAVLHRALDAHPRMAHAALEVMGERVRVLSQQLEDLTLYPVVARLARFLLAQAEDPSLSGPGITRAAIAAHLATTPETISRALNSIQEAGAIRFDRHRILITDEDRLRTIAAL